MSNPERKVTVSPFDKALQMITWSLLALQWLLIFFFYPSLPEITPIHFNVLGEADRYGKKEVLLLIPVITTVLSIGFYYLMKIPHIYNYSVTITEENAARQYTNSVKMLRYLNLLLTLFFVVIVVSIYFSITNNELAFRPYFIPFFIALLFIPIVYFSIQSRRIK